MTFMPSLRFHLLTCMFWRMTLPKASSGRVISYAPNIESGKLAAHHCRFHAQRAERKDRTSKGMVYESPIVFTHPGELRSERPRTNQALPPTVLHRYTSATGIHVCRFSSSHTFETQKWGFLAERSTKNLDCPH